MKSFFSGACLPCLVAAFLVLPSCSAVINITGSDTTTGNLVLVDRNGNPADTFQVESGQKIKWKIKTTTVKSIESIPPKKAAAHGVFRKDPRKKFLSRSWKGKTIKTEATVSEEYNIIWTDSSGERRTYDPLIQVNPRRV